MISCIREYDIRGVVGKDLTADIIRRIAQAYAEYLSRQDFSECIIGVDCRGSGPFIAEALMKALAGRGITVYYAGRVASPVLCYLCIQLHTPGAMVTASHNPPEYNGIIFVNEEGDYDTRAVDYIRQRIYSTEGTMQQPDIIFLSNSVESYIESLPSVPEDAELRVLVDCMHGSAWYVLSKLESKLPPGIQLDFMRREPLPDFGGIRPEPSPANLKELARRVKEEGYDLGIAFDGDADRCMVVDDKGVVWKGSELGFLLALELGVCNRTVVVAVDISERLRTFLEHAGARIKEVRLGLPYLEQAVRKEHAVFGIEQSSHSYLESPYHYSDSFRAMMLVLRAASRIRLSTLRSLLGEIYLEKIYIHAGNDERKMKAYDLIVKELKMRESSFKETVDGVRVDRPEGWVLIRYSRTMPEINLVVEGYTREGLEKLKKEFTAFIKQCIAKISN